MLIDIKCFMSWAANGQSDWASAVWIGSFRHHWAEWGRKLWKEAGDEPQRLTGWMMQKWGLIQALEHSMWSIQWETACSGERNSGAVRGVREETDFTEYRLGWEQRTMGLVFQVEFGLYFWTPLINHWKCLWKGVTRPYKITSIWCEART